MRTIPTSQALCHLFVPLTDRTQNPGLARRFNVSNPIKFEDYNEQELAFLLTTECERQGIEMPLVVKREALKKLVKLKSLPNFGNAGAVQTMLADAKAKKAMRLQVGCTLRVAQHGECAGGESEKHPSLAAHKFSLNVPRHCRRPLSTHHLA
jgi:hypothetical protein